MPRTSPDVEEGKELTGSHSPSPVREPVASRHIADEDDDDGSDVTSSSSTTVKTAMSSQVSSCTGSFASEHVTTSTVSKADNKQSMTSTRQPCVYAAPGGPEVLQQVVAVDPHPGSPPVDDSADIAEHVHSKRKVKKKHKGEIFFYHDCS